MVLLVLVIASVLGLTALEWWALVFPVGHFVGLGLVLLLSAIKFWLIHLWLTTIPQQSTLRRVRGLVVFFLAVLLMLLAISVAGRRLNWPIYVNDGALQTEAALDKLVHGLSPYGADYRGTSVASYHYPTELGTENPALYHFVYLPGTLLVSLPVYELSRLWPGFYDQRWLSFLALLVLLIVLFRHLWHRRELAYLVPLLVASSWFVPFFLLGYNDVVPITVVVLGLVLLAQPEKHLLAGLLVLLFSTTIKQTTWFAVIPALVTAWFAVRKVPLLKRLFWRGFAWGVVLVVLVVAPFWLWAGYGFWSDTVGYIMGTVQHTYPAFGVGLAEWLVRLGVLTSRQAAFPFDVLQLVVGVPLGGYLMYKLTRSGKIDVAAILKVWVVWIGGTWFVARYFAINHLAFLIIVLGLDFALQVGAPKRYLVERV